METILHIVPMGDCEKHLEDGASCKCNPKIEFEDGYMKIIHNAFDMREVIERVEEFLDDKTKNKN